MKLSNEGDGVQFLLSKDTPPITHLFFADDIILFAEANITTIQCINDVLSYFCKISSQRINTDKSKVWFSPNTQKSISKKLSAFMNLKPTDNLGTYLAISFSTREKNKKLCLKLPDSFNRRVQNWQNKYLS